MPYHELLAEPMARLVGALLDRSRDDELAHRQPSPDDVSFYRPTRERHRILLEEHAFPSDDYAVESQAILHGFDPAEALVRLGPPGQHTIDTAEVAEVLERDGESIALVLLPGVQYYTGEAFEIEAITRLAHQKGCVVGFDLAHAAGNLVLSLHEWNVDFAVWCTYKYLNSGPGSVGGCFVHERHGIRQDLPRLAGWWGHDKESRFRMEPGFRPIPGAEGWQLSNPPILSLAAIRASLDVFMEAGGMEPLREKSLRLTGYLEWLLQRELGDAVEILTPGDPHRRGCQLSLQVKSNASGRTVFERLEASGVTCDWREPDVIRVAPVPLYNRFEEVHRFVEILRNAHVRTPRETPEITLVGAGLAGSLLAIFLARRGYRVTLLERRLDPRKPSTAAAAGRSINLALANRGITALEEVGVMESVRSALIPMAGRMLHDEEGRLRLIPYGNKPHEVIYSVSRAGLNTLLLDAAESTGRVSIRFGETVCGVDFADRQVRFLAGEDPEPANASDALRRPHRDGWKRLGGSRRDPGTDRRTARRGAARPRVQGALDSRGGRRPIPDGEGRPAHLAERRIHADRAPQPRRQFHRDPVSAESGGRKLPGPDDDRGRLRALRTPIRGRDSAHAPPRRGVLRESHRPSGDDPLRALVVRGSCARPGRRGARDRSLSRAGHERGVRRLQRLRSMSGRSRSAVERGLRANSKSAAGPIPTRSPTWPWKTTSRCGPPSGSRSFS